MEVIIDLFFTFFKVGLLGFGGGYAMIPLMEASIVSKGWLSEMEFIKIIGIAEVTPGPVAVNSATFVGYKTAGVLGSFFATLGVALPSLVILILVSSYLFKNYDNKILQGVFAAVRPAVAGLIIAAGVNMGRSTFINKADNLFDIKNYQFITISCFLLIILNKYVFKKNIHPILQIFLSGAIGLLSFYFI